MGIMGHPTLEVGRSVGGGGGAIGPARNMQLHNIREMTHICHGKLKLTLQCPQVCVCVFVCVPACFASHSRGKS